MKRIFLKMLTLVLGVMLFAASAQANEVPYTIKLDAEEDIYKGYGVDSGYAREVGEDGVYTIVEEAYDDYGNLWGKLKSGAGWVLLSEASVEAPVYIEDTDYTIPLDAWVPIYDFPSEMDGIFVGIIGEDGVFTVVSEVLDESGNVWGELKSGIGWVNLNYVRYMGMPALTAYPAESIISENTDYTVYIEEETEYTTWIAFRANEAITDVSLTELFYTEDGYEVADYLHYEETIGEDAYLVAGVEFYGDMTVYGISFVDSFGEERFYAVSLSGMNGAIMLNEYVQ